MSASTAPSHSHITFEGGRFFWKSIITACRTAFWFVLMPVELVVRFGRN